MYMISLNSVLIQGMGGLKNYLVWYFSKRIKRSKLIWKEACLLPVHCPTKTLNS